MRFLLQRVRSGAAGALLPGALVLAGCGAVAGTDQSDDPVVSDPAGDPVAADETTDPETDRVILRDTALGGNSTGVHRCNEGYLYSHYEDRHAGSTQLHVVGVYTSEVGAGTIDVQVKRSGTSILVLSAYDPTHWRVTAAAGSQIERVIVTGYEVQTASVPEGVPLEIHTHEGGGTPLAGVAAYEWPTFSATDLVDAAEERTGAKLASFRSCYDASGFDIDEPGEIRPPHPVTDEPEPTILAGCEALTAESNYCMAAGFGQLMMIGLDTGTVCFGDGIPSPERSGLSSSLGWQGDYVYACDHERGIVRVSVKDGTMDVAPVACDMVTTNAAGLVGRFFSTDLAQFSSFKQAAARQAARTVALNPRGTRMAIHGNQAYFAWHSTNEIETAKLSNDAPITTISLEGYDDWITAMDVTDDGRLFIANFDASIHVFDAATGTALGTVPLDTASAFLNGMNCVAGGG